MEEQARRFGLEIILQEIVEVDVHGEESESNTEMSILGKLDHLSRREYRKLGVKGEMEFAGGLSYLPL